MSGDTQYLWCHLHVHGLSLEKQRYPLRIALLRNRVTAIVSDRLKNFYAVEEYYFQGFF